MNFHEHVPELPIGTKQTSKAWYEQLYPNHEVIIYDPDGWDRRNYQYSYYEELITLEEFQGRMMASTCLWVPNALTDLQKKRARGRRDRVA